MGTKRHPAPNDCYAKAEPDEPMFTLLARDPLAPDLIRLWAALRAGLFGTAGEAYELLLQEAAGRSLEERNGDVIKAAEAGDCANAMETWRIQNRAT